MTIRGKLTALLAGICMMLVGIAGVGVYGEMETHSGLEEVYEERTLSVGRISKIRHLLMEEYMAARDAVNDPSRQKIDALERTLEDDHERIEALWQTYASRTLEGAERRLADAFASARAVFTEDGLEPTLAALQAGDLVEAYGLAKGPLAETFAGSLAAIEALVNFEIQAARAKHLQEQTLFANLRTGMISVIVVSVALSVVLGGLLVRSIVQPLGRAVVLADAIAEGDLSQDVESDGQDETGQLLTAMGDMSRNLRKLVGEIQDMSDTVAEETAHLAEGNTSLSQRTEEQAASLEETASSMEQMGATVRQSAESTVRANGFAADARTAAEKGGAVIDDATAAMSELNASAERVASIVGVIDDLAFQTNLLALNAAVEAARAGESGRGFAVVASEVRSLAERSASSAREIRTLIQTSVSEIQNGSALVEDSGRTLADIVDRVKKVSDIVRELAAAAEEQSSGIDQVGRAIAQLDEVTQQNAAMVEEAAASSRTQADLAERLRGLVTGYRTRQAGAGSTSAA